MAGGRIAGGLDSPSTSIPPRALPAGRVTAADLGALRFVPVLRGYRMDQVDAALDRLGQELADRDQELAELRRLVGAVGEPEEAAEAEPGVVAEPADDGDPAPQPGADGR